MSILTDVLDSYDGCVSELLADLANHVNAPTGRLLHQASEKVEMLENTTEQYISAEDEDDEEITHDVLGLFDDVSIREEMDEMDLEETG